MQVWRTCAKSLIWCKRNLFHSTKSSISWKRNLFRRQTAPILKLSTIKYAGVAELADALASGASDRKVVWVQVPSPAPRQVVEIRLVFLLLIHFKTAVAELHQIFDLVEAELVPHTESASFRCRWRMSRVGSSPVTCTKASRRNTACFFIADTF